MLDFKSQASAIIILSGIEMVHMIRNRQERGAFSPNPSLAEQFAILGAQLASAPVSFAHPGFAVAALRAVAFLRADLAGVASAYFGRAAAIIKQRERIKRQTIEQRRLQHRNIAA